MCCSRDAAKKLIAIQDELSTTTGLPTSRKGQSETSKSITLKAYFPPNPQTAIMAETSQKQKKKNSALKELKQEARRRHHAKAKRTERQPTIWEQMEEMDSEEVEEEEEE